LQDSFGLTGPRDQAKIALNPEETRQDTTMHPESLVHAQDRTAMVPMLNLQSATANAMDAQSRFLSGWKTVREELVSPVLGGWKAVHHEESGKTYYWHAATNKTVWQQPPEHATAVCAREAAQAAIKESMQLAIQNRGELTARNLDLQRDAVILTPRVGEPGVHQIEAGTTAAGWQAVAQKETGKVYFWNLENKKTVWRCPPEMMAALGLDYVNSPRAALTAVLEYEENPDLNIFGGGSEGSDQDNEIAYLKEKCMQLENKVDSLQIAARGAKQREMVYMAQGSNRENELTLALQEANQGKQELETALKKAQDEVVSLQECLNGALEQSRIFSSALSKAKEEAAEREDAAQGEDALAELLEVASETEAVIPQAEEAPQVEAETPEVEEVGEETLDEPKSPNSKKKKKKKR